MVSCTVWVTLSYSINDSWSSWIRGRLQLELGWFAGTHLANIRFSVIPMTFLGGWRWGTQYFLEGENYYFFIFTCWPAGHWNVGAFFFFLIFIYLAVPGLSCGTWDLLLMACEIFSCSMQTLSCGMWDLVPRPGIEPRSLALGAWSLSHWATREVQKVVALILSCSLPCDFRHGWKQNSSCIFPSCVDLVVIPPVLPVWAWKLSKTYSSLIWLTLWLPIAYCPQYIQGPSQVGSAVLPALPPAIPYLIL